MRLRSYEEAVNTAHIVNAFNEGVFDSVFDRYNESHCKKNEVYPEIIFQPYNMEYMKPIVFTDEFVYLFTWNKKCNIIRYIEFIYEEDMAFPNIIKHEVDIKSSPLPLDITEEVHFQYSLVHNVSQLNALTMYSVLHREVKDKTKDFYFSFRHYDECLEHLKSTGYIK